jgi:hypothetical protein
LRARHSPLCERPQDPQAMVMMMMMMMMMMLLLLL